MMRIQQKKKKKKLHANTTVQYKNFGTIWEFEL